MKIGFILSIILFSWGNLLKDKHINYKLNLVYKILTEHYLKDSLEICPSYVKRLPVNHEFNYIVKEYIPVLISIVGGIYFEGIRNLNNHQFIIG